MSGAHYPERPSTLYPWANPCPDWAIFRHVFPANACLCCGPHITEINAESPASFVRFPQPFLSLSALILAICGPQQRRTFAGNNGCLSDLVWEMDAPGNGLLNMFNIILWFSRSKMIGVLTVKYEGVAFSLLDPSSFSFVKMKLFGYRVIRLSDLVDLWVIRIKSLWSLDNYKLGFAWLPIWLAGAGKPN